MNNIRTRYVMVTVLSVTSLIVYLSPSWFDLANAQDDCWPDFNVPTAEEAAAGFTPGTCVGDEQTFETGSPQLQVLPPPGGGRGSVAQLPSAETLEADRLDRLRKVGCWEPNPVTKLCLEHDGKICEKSYFGVPEPCWDSFDDYCADRTLTVEEQVNTCRNLTLACQTSAFFAGPYGVPIALACGYLKDYCVDAARERGDVVPRECLPTTPVVDEPIAQADQPIETIWD